MIILSYPSLPEEGLLNRCGYFLKSSKSAWRLSSADKAEVSTNNMFLGGRAIPSPVLTTQTSSPALERELLGERSRIEACLLARRFLRAGSGAARL
jgi:hypothetical protein